MPPLKTPSSKGADIAQIAESVAAIGTAIWSTAAQIKDMKERANVEKNIALDALYRHSACGVCLVHAARHAGHAGGSAVGLLLNAANANPPDRPR